MLPSVHYTENPREIQGFSRTEKDTDKLTVLYLEGRAQCEEQLESLARYLLKQG